MDGPKRFFDISKPGTAPAAPNSRSTITTNQPVTSDPMFAPAAPSNPIAPPPVAPEPEAQSEQVAEPSAPPAPVTDFEEKLEALIPTVPAPSPQTANVSEPVHKLSHQEAFFGHVGSHGKGKKKVLAIFLVILLIAAAAGGYFLWKKGQDKKANDAKTATANDLPAATTPAAKTDSKLYTSKVGNFSVTNAYDWEATELDSSKELSEFNSKEILGTVSFAINSTQSLLFNVNPGGRGGDCTPKAKDVPFKAGNFCSSYKLLSYEQLPDANFPESRRRPSSVHYYLSTYQYMGSKDTEPYTLAGIEVTQKGTATAEGEIKPEIGKSEMGAYLGLTSFTLGEDAYIDIKIVDKDLQATRLSEQDLARVTEMLKSFKLNK